MTYLQSLIGKYANIIFFEDSKSSFCKVHVYEINSISLVHQHNFNFFSRRYALICDDDHIGKILNATSKSLRRICNYYDDVEKLTIIVNNVR